MCSIGWSVRSEGESRALVVYGEAGIGKTALLEYLAGQASGCRIARAAGVQSEMELAFAGLHQLCAPMLDHLERLPPPQRDALRTAFGMSAGSAPDQFLLGLAVLSLLSDVADEQPLLCLIDDQQWLDRASAQALAFVARRLGAESVGLVFGARIPGADLAGLPELEVTGLPVADARRCWTRRWAARWTPGYATRSSPRRAAIRWHCSNCPRPHGPELAGGFGLPGAAPLVGRPRGKLQTPHRRPAARQTRQLLLLAAADPTGDPALVWRAAARLVSPPTRPRRGRDRPGRVRHPGPIPPSAGPLGGLPVGIGSGETAGASRPGGGHRSRADADRRAWHRAHAAPGPDEDVAAELERSAVQAQARGGLAAAAAFLERAAALTQDPAQRAERALAAAQAKVEAGAIRRGAGPAGHCRSGTAQ